MRRIGRSHGTNLSGRYPFSVLISGLGSRRGVVVSSGGGAQRAERGVVAITRAVLVLGVGAHVVVSVGFQTRHVDLERVVAVQLGGHVVSVLQRRLRGVFAPAETDFGDVDGFASVAAVGGDLAAHGGGGAAYGALFHLHEGARHGGGGGDDVVGELYEVPLALVAYALM